MKKGAIEMSIGTIVVIVLAVVMLILGIVFVRGIMCAGIIIGDDITSATENEIRSLFQGNDVGVKCMGSEGDEVRIATGGRRQIPCVIIVEQEMEFDLKLDLTSDGSTTIKGADWDIVESNWLIDHDWSGSVTPGKDGKTVVVAVLDIPSNAPTTTLKLQIQAKQEGDNIGETITSYIDVVPVGWFKSAIC